MLAILDLESCQPRGYMWVNKLSDDKAPIIKLHPLFQKLSIPGEAPVIVEQN